MPTTSKQIEEEILKQQNLLEYLHEHVNEFKIFIKINKKYREFNLYIFRYNKCDNIQINKFY